MKQFVRHSLPLRSYATVAWFAAWVLILPVVLACCSRSVGDDNQCPGPDLLTTPLVAANAIIANGTCIFEEEQDGRQHRIVCDGQSCRWFIDDVMTCECQQLDFANTCANGVPTCADWQGSIDYSSP